MPPDTILLDKLVQSIIKTVHPHRILVFGSAARNEMGPDSDIDVLVVMPDGIHRRQTAQTIYRGLWGLGFAKDIIVVTESDIQAHAENPYMVIKQALEEGREVYHAV